MHIGSGNSDKVCSKSFFQKFLLDKQNCLLYEKEGLFVETAFLPIFYEKKSFPFDPIRDLLAFSLILYVRPLQ